MSFVFALLGILVGAVTGIAIGFCQTYTSVNEKNTIGSSRNPELPPVPPTSVGNRIFMIVFGLIFFAAGVLMLFLGVKYLGLSGAELAQAMGPNTHVASGVSGGTLVVLGLFLGFIGGGVTVTGITNK